VAVVLPYGSRVATSRINFRLLGRDALTHEKRLSIVAADAASRALAASAGLPVFASLAEYESSLEPRPGAGGGSGDAGGTPGAIAGSVTAAGAAAMVGDAAAGTGAAAIPAGPPGAKATKRPRKTAAQRKAEAEAAEAAAAGAAAVTAAGAGDEAGAADPVGPWITEQPDATDAARTTIVPAVAAGETRGAATRPTPDLATARASTVSAATAASAAAPSVDRGSAPPLRTTPVARPAMRRPGLTPIAIGGAVLALAVVVGGVGAYLLLPSASVVVTPRDETIGPLRMSISASESVSAPDVTAGTVPAETLTVEVDATRQFPVTGVRVEETKSKGTVRFRNKDFTRSNTIPKGSIVSTQSGIRFRTNSAVTVPRAELVGLQVFPATANVKVTAVKEGPDGNVEPNTILIIPRGEDPLTLDVSNPDATAGGTREEFARIDQKDIDTALAQLAADLQAAFDERLTDPTLAPEGATLFRETGILGDPVYSVEPASLLDQEVETFDLAASASGTVRAVDTAAVQAVAEERLTSSVEAGHQLVDGSSDITVEDAVVSEDRITFPVIATATQVAILDPAEIEAAIRGLPLEDAQRVLGDYGVAELNVWPDWVSTIPTIDARVDVTIGGPVEVETESPSGAPSEPAP
jgi:hypothetical protein